MTIDGVDIRPLQTLGDLRGHLAEFFRTDWPEAFRPEQFHVLHSLPGSMRGVHVHVRHHDWKVVLLGRTTLGLKDLRQGSPTEGAATRIELHGDEPVAVHIPPGVAHGQLAHDLSITAVGSSRLYDPSDDLGCSWSDPELGIEWSFEPTLVSERDRSAQSLRDLVAELEQWQPL